MSKSFTFAKVAGIPIQVQANWFLIAVLVTWSLSVGYYPLSYPDWSTATYWLVGAVTAILFFASVLAHELGHGLVALTEDVPVNSITLFIFGGVAHIGREPSTANADFRIVVAGPFTSLVLAAAFFVLGLFSMPYPEFSAVASYLAYMNLILALFNLLPGYPLDGGRILRAVFWKITDNFQVATRLATFAGYLIAGIFALAGFALMVFMQSIFSGLWLVFIGLYLAYVAWQSYTQSILYDPTKTPIRPTLPMGQRIHVRQVKTAPRGVYSSTFFLMGIGQPAKHILLPQPLRGKNCQIEESEPEEVG